MFPASCNLIFRTFRILNQIEDAYKVALRKQRTFSDNHCIHLYSIVWVASCYAAVSMRESLSHTMIHHLLKIKVAGIMTNT